MYRLEPKSTTSRMVSELGIGLAGPKDLGRCMGVDNICLFCFSLRALKSNVFGIAAKADMFSARVLRVAACGMTRDGCPKCSEIPNRASSLHMLRIVGNEVPSGCCEMWLRGTAKEA
jgi:hypothetical protein